MMKSNRNIAAGLATILMVAMLPACHKEGPAEHAGKELDKAVDTAGEHIEKAGQNIQDAAKGEKK